MSSRLRTALPSAVLLSVLAALPASAQFATTEVSGPGAAAPFLITKAQWSWESIPGVTYSVYRSSTASTGFDCILDAWSGNTWTGDTTAFTPRTSPPEGLFFYLVTAYDGSVDNSPGNWSDGTARTLTTPCPRVPPCASGTPMAGRVPIRLVSIGPNFVLPIYLTAPAGDDRLFVLEKAGRVRIQHADGTRTTFLDVRTEVLSTSNENGALGLAFHPDYATNGKFYMFYTATATGACGPGECSKVSEFTVTANPDVADPASERILFQTGHELTNHNGGWTGFGPDGMLYFSIGDGGNQNDPFNRAQNLGEYQGKIMRIDVDNRDAGLQYAVPPDNPFITTAGAHPEIWTYGMRNPWRCSFDRLTGDLYVGDVGQNAWEEVSWVPSDASGLNAGRGTNLGWRITEGNVCFNPATGCSTAGLTLPVQVYSHSVDGNCAVIGGFCYRGCRMPDWNGYYFCSDNCGEWLDSFDATTGVPATYSRLLPPGALNNIYSFGEDANGEVYALLRAGNVYRLEP